MVHRVRHAIACSAVVALGCGVVWHRAEACGAFFARNATRVPSLAYERALIVYDAKARREHFVREVSFRGDAAPFGFVVPTPSRPDVTKVDGTPFKELENAFPFVPVRPGKDGTREVQGFGGGHGRGATGVTVLDTKKVGSFTASVLAATDETALKDWLDANGLATTPNSDAWLRHYVQRHFFYVAMRYDPPRVGPTPSSGTVRAETIRISFKTPLPYYPYLEPAHEAEARDPRLVSVWLAANEAYVPVALGPKGGSGPRWVRPFRQGFRTMHAHALLAESIGPLASIAPPEIDLVQAFQDQKTSRAGFGDVVFVPEKREVQDAARRAELAPLLALLDDPPESP